MITKFITTFTAIKNLQCFLLRTTKTFPGLPQLPEHFYANISRGILRSVDTLTQQTNTDEIVLRYFSSIQVKHEPVTMNEHTFEYVRQHVTNFLLIFFGLKTYHTVNHGKTIQDSITIL